MGKSLNNTQATSLSKRFVSAFGWNTIGRILSMFVGLLSSAVIARGLGPDNYGLFATVLAIIGFVTLLISFGFGKIINVRLPSLMIEAREAGIGKIVHLIRSILFYRLVLSCCGSICLYLLAPWLAELIHQPNITDYLRIGSIYIAVLGIAGIIGMVFTTQLKIMLSRALNITQQSIRLIFTFILLWKYGLGIYGILYAMIISILLSIIIHIFTARKYLFSKAKKWDISGYYKIGLTAWLLGFVSFALGKQTDIILLNYFEISKFQIGFYNLAFRFSVMISFLAIGIGPIFQAIFSEIYKKKGAEGLANSWATVAKITFLLSLPVFAFVFLYAPSIITIIYGEVFSPASKLFRILVSFKMVYVLMNASFAMPVFYLINRKKIGLYLRILAGVLNLVLDIILIPKYGVIGAVFATGASIALIGVLEIGVVIKNIHARLPILFYLKIMVVFGLALLPTLLIDGETIFPIIFKGVIYSVNSVILMWFLKPIEEQDKQFVKSASEPLYKIIRHF